MPKKKVKQSKPVQINGSSGKKHFVIRDIVTGILFIVDECSLLTSKEGKSNIGSEVTYRTAQRDRGRGVILLIGSEKECDASLVTFECESVSDRNAKSGETVTTSNGSSITMERIVDENVFDMMIEGPEKRQDGMDTSIFVENDDHFQMMNEKNINVLDSTLRESKNYDDISLEDNAAKNSMIKEKSNITSNHPEKETDNSSCFMECNDSTSREEEEEKIGDSSANNVISEKSFQYMYNTTSDNSTQAVLASNATDLNDQALNSPTNEKTLHHNRSNMKRSNLSSENSSVRKRLKSGIDGHCSSAQCIALQRENMKLKSEIEFIKSHYIPRPNPETIDYFATVVSICTGNTSHFESNEKLDNVIKTLGLSEHELDDCVDAKSIRKTCRNIMRKVFKSQLKDPTVHYSKILSKNEQKMAAIRQFGRMKHPLESLKFNDGDLNNAMGSDFYQRDHLNKINSEN